MAVAGCARVRALVRPIWACNHCRPGLYYNISSKIHVKLLLLLLLLLLLPMVLDCPPTTPSKRSCSSSRLTLEPAASNVAPPSPSVNEAPASALAAVAMPVAVVTVAGLVGSPRATLPRKLKRGSAATAPKSSTTFFT